MLNEGINGIKYTLQPQWQWREIHRKSIEAKKQNSWLQLDIGYFQFLATMNNAALNIFVQFLWMGTLSWVYT